MSETFIDHRGDEYKRYLFEYNHAGKRWGFDVWATSIDDAKAKARRMAHADYLGESMITIPVRGALMTKLANWVARTFGERSS